VKALAQKWSAHRGIEIFLTREVTAGPPKREATPLECTVVTQKVTLVPCEPIALHSDR
jgi:hypothetical protein